MAGISEHDDFVADINVTPFVDVMLVLLVIFMVTAPMMTEGLELDLPQAQTAEVLPTDDATLVLSIKRDGSLYLETYPVALAELPVVLKNSVLLPHKKLFLRADKQVDYGRVMDVMGRVRAAGIKDLGMVAESVPETGAPEPVAGPRKTPATSSP